MVRTVSRRVVLSLSLSFAAALAGFTWAPLHFELDRSMPEADSSVASPSSIDLWFTQVPQESSTTIRLVTAGGNLVETSEVVQDESNGKHQSIAVEGTLAPGAYTVAWRSMASDGHVVRDEFVFTVQAEGDR